MEPFDYHKCPIQNQTCDYQQHSSYCRLGICVCSQTFTNSTLSSHGASQIQTKKHTCQPTHPLSHQDKSLFEDGCPRTCRSQPSSDGLDHCTYLGKYLGVYAGKDGRCYCSDGTVIIPNITRFVWVICRSIGLGFLVDSKVKQMPQTYSNNHF